MISNPEMDDDDDQGMLSPASEEQNNRQRLEVALAPIREQRQRALRQADRAQEGLNAAQQSYESTDQSLAQGHSSGW